MPYYASDFMKDTRDVIWYRLDYMWAGTKDLTAAIVAPFMAVATIPCPPLAFVLLLAVLFHKDARTVCTEKWDAYHAEKVRQRGLRDMPRSAQIAEPQHQQRLDPVLDVKEPSVEAVEQDVKLAPEPAIDPKILTELPNRVSAEMQVETRSMAVNALMAEFKNLTPENATQTADAFLTHYNIALSKERHGRFHKLAQRYAGDMAFRSQIDTAIQEHPMYDSNGNLNAQLLGKLKRLNAS